MSMGSPWKALADDNRRQILLILKKKDMIPTEIAKHFNFTLAAVSTHLRILRDADLLTEKKLGKNRFYSLNNKRTLDMIEFFEDVYDFKLNSLKEYVENKERKKMRLKNEINVT
jgi:ArsR family transcriptional regulator